MTYKLIKYVVNLLVPINNKLIIRPVSNPPMIIVKKKEVKNTSKELSILIKSKTGC